MAKRKKLNKIADPFADREAQKYANPIPSREFILDHLRSQGKPVRRNDLIAALGLSGAEGQDALRKRLRAMERDGQLILTRNGAYGVVDKLDLIRGSVIGHKDGYGFVVPDDGSGDLYLNPRHMRAVFNGDKVLVSVTGIDRKGKREGALVEVLESRTQTLVGRLHLENTIAFLTPNNKRINQEILIPADEIGKAKPGDIVQIEIITQPSLHARPTGRVVKILGDEIVPGMEIELAIHNHNLPHVWPETVEKETAHLKNEVEEKDKQGRVDLRNLPLVTIDGEDAKDFDDAVYCEKRLLGGWKLYVAIADVSHYVKPDTQLDLEANKRGNSVYFPGKVIPMLPEVLSNNLCSLKPKVDRLCLVCEMTIGSDGTLGRYRFYDAVMRSRARLTYTEVSRWLENPKGLMALEHRELLPHLKALKQVFKALLASREERGAIDFETRETKVIFGKDRRIEKIVPTERTIAHRIIEECMLMANVAAAKFLIKHKLSALFRIHSGPNPEKLQDLQHFLSGLGLSLSGGKEPEPTDYKNLLKKIVKRPDAHLIQTVLLRSLSQAVYSPENIGHFGLAFPAYAHFTSPIRRYPDLIVHRGIRHLLRKGTLANFQYNQAAMVSIGEYCSMTERRADEATREAMDWLKCEFMRDRVGEEFDGIITNVTSFGLFIELSDVYIEGLLHVTSLKNDYYHFDPVKHRLQGERTGVAYHLGEKIRVQVVRVDLESRQIDFALHETAAEAKKAAKNANKKAVKKERSKNKRQKKTAGVKRGR